jgi:membrane-bound inhibitor of C-type lysozyme
MRVKTVIKVNYFSGWAIRYADMTVKAEEFIGVAEVISAKGGKCHVRFEEAILIGWGCGPTALLTDYILHEDGSMEALLDGKPIGYHPDDRAPKWSNY